MQSGAGMVDVVVVSYNSRAVLRECVEGLAREPDFSVIVVDNASSDGSLDAVADLPVTAVAQERNAGFAHGCNAGWRLGSARYVLFLNPDARIEPVSLRRLAVRLEDDPRLGAAAPRIHGADGSLDLSLRRFPRLRSTYARALFLHRVFPGATWTDELVRTPGAYEVPGHPDWVSGACVLVRRTALEQLGGLDERFFMYCEDIDLCKRLAGAGWGLAYEPTARAVHAGGASAPRTGLVPVLAASRILYAHKHHGALRSALERLGVALEALTHLVVSRGGLAARRGHARALRLAGRLGAGRETDRTAVAGSRSRS